MNSLGDLRWKKARPFITWKTIQRKLLKCFNLNKRWCLLYLHSIHFNSHANVKI